jgi:hypothetical protein
VDWIAIAVPLLAQIFEGEQSILASLQEDARVRMASPDTSFPAFVHDDLLDGRRSLALTVIDEWSWECLAIKVDLSLTGERITRVLEPLCGMQECQRSPSQTTDPSSSVR